MDFSFTEEQEMLLATTRRLLAEQYGLEQRRRIIASPEGYSRATWRQFAALGLLGLNVPEQHGGLEAGPISTFLVCVALGEALVVDPYLSSAVLATRAVASFGSPAQRAQWLAQLASGELIAVMAHEETVTRPSRPIIATRASRCPGGWSLEGRKSVVYHAPTADVLLVTALIDETAGGEWGLFAVPRNSPGLQLQTYATVDDQLAADVLLSCVKVPADARIGGDVLHTLSTVLDYGVAALCGEAFGALDKLLSMTLEYARIRVQFGQPIGRFQALQHRMADMLTHLEQSRSMAYLAASSCVDPDEARRIAALSAAKVVIGRAARFVGQQAIQLHGGMGMTDELAVSHYFKRLLAFEIRCGSTEEHLERYAARALA